MLFIFIDDEEDIGNVINETNIETNFIKLYLQKDANFFSTFKKKKKKKNPIDNDKRREETTRLATSYN